MVQARPIPGYLSEPDTDEFGSLSNGHEEINLEARRRHRQEKLPPLSPSTEAAEANAATEASTNPDQEDAEKILTIEQACSVVLTFEKKDRQFPNSTFSPFFNYQGDPFFFFRLFSR